MRYRLKEPPHERRDNHCAWLSITVSSRRIDSRGGLETAYTLKLRTEKKKKVKKQIISLWLAEIR
jgi:hypothetical protein